MLIIRKEHCNDYPSIELITKQVSHKNSYYTRKEHPTPERLRNSPLFTFALVAEYKKNIIAHIAIASVQINAQKANVFTITSLVVLPEFQGKGIASKLVKMVLSRLAKGKAHCCVLVGEPTFYHRLGFNTESSLTFQGAPKEYLQSFYFKTKELKGELTLTNLNSG